MAAASHLACKSARGFGAERRTKLFGLLAVGWVKVECRFTLTFQLRTPADYGALTIKKAKSESSGMGIN